MTSAQRRRLYYGTRWKRVREAAKRRDGWRCTECGRLGRLEVHHIDRDPARFFEMGNLATLCRGCHIRVHKRMRPNNLEWGEMVRKLRQKAER